MSATTIDLEYQLVAENTKSLLLEERTLDEQRKLDFEASKVEASVAEAYRAGIMAELGFDYQLATARAIRKERNDFAALPQNRIMGRDAIRATCLKYGLRFLPTRFYRGALDAGIGPAVAKVKNLLGGKLPEVDEPEQIDEKWTGAAHVAKVQMYIAAPSSAFQLQPRPQDPLLFLRLSAIKYYLVHKWGDDLKTGDVRAGEINEGNWNSVFSNGNRIGMSMASLASQLGQMQSNWSGTTASTINAVQWTAQSNPFQFTT